MHSEADDETPALGADRALVEAFLWAGPTLARLRDEGQILATAADVVHWQGLDVQIVASDGGVLASRGRRFDMDDRVALRAVVAVDGAPHATLVIRGSEHRAATAAALQLFADHLGVLIENARQHSRVSGARIARERFTALGEAAAVLAHEVRNPLAVLRSASVLVERDDREVRREAAEMIREEVSRLELLVRDLLQLARPLEPRPIPSPIGALARAAVDRARGVDVDRHVQIDVSEELSINVDPALFALAIGNLVRNALDSAHATGLVVVSLEEREHSLAVAVDDDGAGVDASQASRIFEAFHTTRATGTGLGLSIAKRIVEAHGGVIDLRRSALGGARFEVVLPIDLVTRKEVSS